MPCSRGIRSSSSPGSSTVAKTAPSAAATPTPACHSANVRPVTSGYRVVLTYNLLLVGDTVGSAAGRTDPGLATELARCLDEHFDDSDEPTRLVYLLDHEYTQRALGWAWLNRA